MGWEETCAVTERMKFVLEVKCGERTVAECCRLAGVSRKTGYKWLGRYDEGGLRALGDRSRAPRTHPNAVGLEVKAMLLEARRQHPNWGAVTLLEWFGRRHPKVALPAASTVAELLKREGLVKPRVRTRRTPPHEAVRPWFERLFREYGLPLAIRTDNGVPFASRALAGLSRLSAWWLRLGITPERIEPGCPQQNGRHERMHRTLKRGSCTPPRASLAAQQRAFDRFKTEYNEERPHHALGKATPVQLYQASPRPYPSRLPELEYPSGFTVRRVRHGGDIKWQGKHIYVTNTLIGEPVGLYQVDEELWSVFYGALELGRLDARCARVEPKT